MVENAPHTRARRAWLAPLLSTVVTLPVALIVFVFVALLSMACDSCTDAEIDRFDPSFDTAFTVYQFGLLIPLAFLIGSWALPWQQRNRARRVNLSVLAPVSVVLVYLLFLALVDWP